MSIIKIEALGKNFGKVNALKGISLEVQKGEVYGFIGPNGAGKTTTIRILLGILKASQGQAKIFGKDVWKNAVDIHRQIAYVPGEVNLWPDLTGGEVIDLFLSLRGKNNHNRRDELIEKFNLDPSKKCRTYSKGNRQKVALIAAFSAESDLYIFDEPTSGLDPLMERVFQQYVKAEKKQGKSIFLSSHILSEVEKLCDKVSIIREGEIIESGSLKDLRHLTRTNMTVETPQDLKPLATKKGIYNFEQNNAEYIFQVDTEHLSDIIKYLSNFNILRLENTPPKLEDLFIRHYQSDGGIS